MVVKGKECVTVEQVGCCCVAVGHCVFDAGAGCMTLSLVGAVVPVLSVSIATMYLVPALRRGRCFVVLCTRVLKYNVLYYCTGTPSVHM